MADTSGPWDQYRASAPPAADSEDGPWRNYGGSGALPSRSIVRSAADTAIAAGTGVVQGVKMLSDVAGADNPVSRGLGAASDALTDLESPYRKAQKQERAAKIQEAEASGSTLKEIGAHLGSFADAPIDTTVNAAGTILPTIAATVLTGGGAAAAAVPAVVGGLQGIGNIKGSVSDAVKRKALQEGASEAEAAKKADEAQAYSGENLGNIVVGGALGALAGGTGVQPAIGRLLGRKVATEVAERAAPGVVRSTVEGVLKESPMEALQGGQERYSGNVAQQRAGFDVPTWQGVAGQAALEGVAAAPLGGAVGATEGVHARGEARAAAQADAQARKNAETAAADAKAKMDQIPAPLALPNTPPDRLYVFPDGTVGRTGEVESYIASLPEDQQAAARASFAGQNYTELNDPQRQQDRRWWENYGDGQAPAPRPDYLAEVQQAVRSGTPFTTQATVDTVRNAMEDAWLEQNVSNAAPVATQAADTVGAQLQGEFDQAGQDASLAATDARVRTGRILSGLQNILDAGADNTVQVLNRLNDGLSRVNEAPLAPDEMARVRRITDAYMGFRGVGEQAPLPGNPAPPVDRFADNAAMEAQIPQRPSERMGINPAAGPLSKAAATAVDSGLTPVLPTTVTALAPQENPNAQTAQAPLAGAAAAIPAARAATVETAGPGSVFQPVGVASVPQASQTEQSRPSAQEGRAAPSGPQTEGLTNATQTGNNSAQAVATGAAPGQAASAAPAVTTRPKNWRTSMLGAGPVAKSMGLDPKGKRTAQVVAEIDAADAQRAGVAQDGKDLSAGQIDREWSAFASETGTLGVPRADMPQIKAEHRGALVNFLKARGIDSQAAEVPANDLKPTQAEFSQAKVDKARDFKGGDRSILVSSDGYVVDGHHQWLAKRANGEPVKVIRLKAPIRDVLSQVQEFPSVAIGQGADAYAQQRRDFADAERRRAAPGQRARSAAAEANPLRAFLGKHGVSMDLRSEFAPGRTEQRQAMVPGYGPIFRKSGRQLDALAQAAVEEGFLSSPDSAAMQALIDLAMRGERVVPQFAEGVAQSEMDARIARRREMEEDEALTALDRTDDALAFDLDDSGIPWDAEPSNTTTEQFLRAMGASEKEIQDAVAQESRGTQESNQGRSGPEQATAGRPQGSDAQAYGASRPGGSSEVQGGEPGSVEDVKRDGYTRDLFGGSVDWSSRSGSRESRPPGNVQPATTVQGDTPALEGEYRVRTIVGTRGERQLGVNRIQSLADLATATQYLYRSAVERFDGIVTDSEGTPLAVVGGFKGALSQTSVYPSTIIGEAVRVPGAARIWFSHNHPSGSPEISAADERVGRNLHDAFRGTGIQPMGLIAVGNGRFSSTSGESGDIGASVAQVRVPVIERELASNSGTPGAFVDAPDTARSLSAAYYNEAQAPGLILLNPLHRVIGWVPLPSQMMGDLRGTGQLRALYRAVSESNAFAAILAHGGELDTIHPSSSSITVGQNIGAALSGVDVRVLDIINAKTGKSAVLSGIDTASGPVFSRRSGGMTTALAAELMRLRTPATVDSVRAAVRQLVNGLGSLPNSLGRVVVATSDEIKQHWEPLIGTTGMEAAGEAGRAQGFYDPNTRTVFLVADHIKAGEEVGVVAHELMHKHGQAVLGAEGWNRLHGAIEGWARAAEGSMERRVYDEAAARVQASRPQGADATAYSSQELFPYAVQVALEMGVKPNLLAKPGTVARWLGEVKRALRQVWEKITRKPDAFNSQDLVNLAFGIAQRENPEHTGELDGAIAPLRTATNFLQARMAAKEFQGKELTNAATGMTAVVARNSLDKMLSAKAVEKSETPATHAMAVANADNLFERAILGWSKPDRSNDPNIRAIHRFFAPMDVNGRTKLVKLTVKESVREDRQNPLYTVEAVELNETQPGLEWLEAAAREDGVSLDEKIPCSGEWVGEIASKLALEQPSRSPAM
ncbi:JAB domain-containing protein [Ottowia sp. VDI28]|uniref:LPD3 domain-containing protein n=1 Tax=Ottowia sp. VDI28 TaxID=3133968 RepID=UPI003C2F43D1